MISVLFTAGEAAESLGITPRTFRRWNVEPTTTRAGKKLYSGAAILDNRIAAIRRQRRRPETTAAQLKSELSSLQAELDRARAAGQALANAAARGELVRVEDLQQTLASACSPAGARLDALAGQIKRHQNSLTFAEVHSIRVAVAAARNQAADTVIDWSKAPCPDREA